MLGDPVWFYWPVTLAVAATFSGVHLAAVGRRHDGSSRPLGLLGPAALAVPALPLLIGVSATCSGEDTHVPHHSPVALVLGGLGLLVWALLVRRLYVIAGLDSASATSVAAALCGCVALGGLVEFFVSTVSLEGHCAGSSPAGLYGQLAAAVVAAALCAVGIVWRERHRAVDPSTVP